MYIHFSPDRMAKVRENHLRWWRGELDRPLIKLTIDDRYPVEPSDVPVLSQANCHDFSVCAEAVIDGLDRELSRKEFLGDAFPMVNFDAFGPGLLAGFCGAQMDNHTGSVWFFPEEELEIEDIHVRYDPDNPFVQRIKAIYRAGLEKWEGSVIMGLPDLGGVMDVSAVLRGNENLLLDLYDCPEEVIRLNREVQTAWYEAYEDLSCVLSPQGLNTNWSGLLSDVPSYIIQCDFCYMIGNAMFRKFVLDTLKQDTERLGNVIYHLDGKGELKHLHDILNLPKLKAVQWVFGDGAPPAQEWMDVYRQIADAGKNIWVCGTPDSFLKVYSQLHLPLYFTYGLKNTDMDLAKELLNISK